ncbi:MAG: trehalose-phosphatase [Deltaproteobacteria bacterium]|nr:MAG: trehalose-phosphatase [Deltaproteobacteria bacterium]
MVDSVKILRRSDCFMNSSIASQPAPWEPDAFQACLDRAERLLLMLDYDGTLAPFVADRNQAWPFPGVLPRLKALQGRDVCRLVIVTGRTVADMPRLLALDPLPEIWGCHGWERRLTDGRLLHPPLPDAWSSALNQAARIDFGLPPDRVERKPFTVAVHWRGLDESLVRRSEPLVRDRFEDIAAAAGLELHAFDGGIELRCPGRTKGTAVADLLTEEDGALALYLGDDLTDEDAFAALGDRGIGLLVRQQVRPSQARWWLRPPEQLLGCLDLLVEWCHGREARA